MAIGDYLVQYGEIVGYAAPGLIALLGLLIVQIVRRRRDLTKARIAVRLASYSISTPRTGPIAVKGPYHQTADERWISSNGQRVALASDVEIVRGTRGRWRGGTRNYTVQNGDEVIAIGIMSKASDGGWKLVTSPGEAGIQILATQPRAAPAPLFPWRAPLILAVWYAIGFFGLYGAGTLVVDVPRADACSDSSQLRLQIAAALPQVRDEALTKLASCRK
jgi:hypothetical protein